MRPSPQESDLAESVQCSLAVPREQSLVARFHGRDAAILAVVCLIAAAVMGKDITRGGLVDPDASAHVMDGVLIHDWLLAGPRAWAAPLHFAREQYGHYPTLGIGGHYPPGFAVAEAGFFLVFGVSATSARLCVVLFGVLAAAGCYVFVRGLSDRVMAAIAAVLLIVLPASTNWGRQVMLELPVVATLMWAAVAFSWYFRAPSWRRFALMCLVALLTILFKQTGVFLICAIAMTLSMAALRGTVPRAHATAAVVIGIVSLIGVLLVLDDACLKTVSGYHTQAPWSAASLLFYPRAIPAEVGWMVVAAAIVGMLISFRQLHEHWWLLSFWVFVSLVMVTVASLKTPRFAYVILPPLAIWASLAAGRLVAAIRIPTLRMAVVTAIIAYTGFVGFRRPVPDGFDFGPLVQACRNKIDQQVVLFSGLRDGDFVFAVREHIPWRRSVVIRGSKLLYTCVAGPDLDMVPYVESPGELAETMKKFAFPQVFVERDNLVGTRQDDWLRTYLKESGDYRLEESVLVRGREGSCGRKVFVDVYSLARPWERQVDHFDIPIPRTRNSIRVDFRAACVSENSS